MKNPVRKAAGTTRSSAPGGVAPAKVGHGKATEMVTAELRRLIQTGEYGPGQHLRQEEIAARLNISKVPVREALTVLTADGVVVHRSNQGYFVPKITPLEMQQIYRMRALLESELVENARWPTPEELARIKEINARLEDAIREGRMDDVIARNRDFHFAIFALSDMKLIEREVRRLWDRSDGYRRVIMNAMPNRQRSIEEHLLIIAALEAKDAAALQAQMAQHRKSGLEKLVELIS